MGIVAGSLYAQLPAHLREYPLAARKASGDMIIPVFNGWIGNEDGSVTMLFGFANRNREEIVDIPLGPNNFLEPAQFDGMQPTHFPIYDRGGFVGINERGAFAVTVPADMAGTEVVWTLKYAGYENSVPGRATSTTYEMSAGERAYGTLAPAIRFEKDGPESISRVGIMAERVAASVGNPVTLSVFVQDPANRSNYPALISGSDRAEEGNDEAGADDWTHVQTQATFWEPGDYVVRLRVDNFSAPASQFHMCR